MATNIIYEPGWDLSVVVTDPTTPASGGPVRYGTMTGLADVSEGGGGNDATKTSVKFGPFVADLSVAAIDVSGNSAVAVGDALFYVDADTPKLSKKASGYFYGYAMEAIDAGSTATINVYHPPAGSHGSVAIGDIPDAVITAAKLTTTMATGFIHLPLTSWRLIASNDIPASGAADGGIISQDTAPKLERVNDATDKKLRIAWAAAGVVEVVNDFVYPPDLNEGANVEFHMLAAMAGATDTPVVGVSYFEGVGDTNAGGNTGAVTGTAVAEYSVAIAHANVGATPKAASVGLIPAAHGNDALYIYATWLEYSRI